MTTGHAARESLQAQARAEAHLAHYFCAVFRKAGIPWDEDNENEVREIVRDILVAAQ